MNKHSEGMSFIGILFAVLIVSALMHFLFKVYFNRSPVYQADKETKQVFNQQGIDTSSYQSVLDSTVSQIKEIEKRQLERPGQIMDQYKDMQQY